MSYTQTQINGFKVSTITGYDGTQLFITDSDGIQIYAHRVSGDPIARAKEVISEITGETFEQTTMKKAQQQATAAAVMMSADDKTGAKRWNAIEKAIKEIAANKTIQFDGKVLTFVSSRSGKRRFVTEHGCSELCDCKGGISYHRALFDIFSRYFELQKESNVIAFPARKDTGGIVTEACGCVFNWNDRFYESTCLKHSELERQREWAMEEEWDAYFEAA
jgi:hypothetical protein